MKIVFNGREYAGPDEIPPEARRSYERLLSDLARHVPEGVAGEGMAREKTGVSHEIVRHVVVSAARTDASVPWSGLHAPASLHRTVPAFLAIAVVILWSVLFLSVG